MMKKMSLDYIKSSLTKRTSRKQSGSEAHVCSCDSENANGDICDCENKDCGSEDRTWENPGQKTRTVMSGRGNGKLKKTKSGLLKNIRRKLTWSFSGSERLKSAKNRESCPSDAQSREDMSCEGFTTNSLRNTKQTKPGTRAVCPMPSPLHLARRNSASFPEVDEHIVNNLSDMSVSSENYSESRRDTVQNNNTINSASLVQLSGNSVYQRSLTLSNSNNDTLPKCDRSASGNVLCQSSGVGVPDVTKSSKPNLNNLHLHNPTNNASHERQVEYEEPQSPISVDSLSASLYEFCDNSVSCHRSLPANYLDTCDSQPRMRSLTRELFKLSKCGWYWGPITRGEAEEKLADQVDGAFLVRDSSDVHHLLSLSFRSCGRTLHTRIEHTNGIFSFYAHYETEPEGYTSIVELIEHSMSFSQSGVFCYSRSRTPGSPSFPVGLTKPISRFTQVRTLQYLCRFVIRQYTRFDHIQMLPLPTRIKGYIEEGHY